MNDALRNVMRAVTVFHIHCLNRIVRSVGIIIVVLLALENLFLAYNNMQSRWPILGMKLAGKPVSNLNRLQITQKVLALFAENQRPLTFDYQSQIITVTPVDVGAKVNAPLVANMVLGTGRTGNLWHRLKIQHHTLFGKENVALTGTISQPLLTLKIAEIQQQVNGEARPIMPDFAFDVNKTIPAKDGTMVNTNKLVVQISDAIFSPPTKTLPLPVIATFTTHTEEELVPIRKQAIEAVKQPISISSAGKLFTLTTDDLRTLLTVAERPDPKNPTKLTLALRLDDKKLNRKLGDFAEQVEAITHAEFNHHDAHAAIYAQFYSGQRKTIAIATGLREEIQLPTAQKKVLAAETGEKKVYLTFDDGPNAIYHPLILDILKQYSIRATFFLVGNNSQKDNEVAKRTKAEGHTIGNHSLTHAFLPKLSASAIHSELASTNSILKNINDNRDIQFFRPPYGGVNLAVKEDTTKLGLKLYLWDVDPRDWSEPTVDELVRRVVSHIQNGSDILLHSNHAVTVQALPKIIEQLKSQGYTFDVLH